MSKTAVYLELDNQGQCMAHLPDFPGLVVRAGTEQEVMAQLPGEVGRYRAWLGRHGEPVGEPAELDVASVVRGTGPFEPDNKASLFEWELTPLPPEEMARFQRLAGYSRADLLALVRPLGGAIRKWRPVGGGMSINQVLRHIGVAEQWYVSRLAAPGTLPPEWDDDSELPVFKFLKMSRKTAVARINQMSDAELNQVQQPSHRTDHPDEKWNGRKMLRRWLQHEWEHADQIRHIMASWRQQLLARLAAERAGLLWQLRGIDVETLSSLPVTGGWTAKDMLAHVGAWDAFHAARVQKVVERRLEKLQQFDEEVMHANNASWQAEFKEVPLEQAVAITLKERSGYLRVLSQLPDARLHQKLDLPNGEQVRVRKWVKWRFQHDEAHAAEMASWRRALPPETKQTGGPPYLMRALLQASHKEFVTLAGLVPAAERDGWPVCGVWTMKDLVGHLADWEQVGLVGLRQLSQQQQPEFETEINDFEQFNQEHAAARREQPWDVVWLDYLSGRRATLQLMAYLSPADMGRSFITPWGTEISTYYWLAIWAMHEREHATDVRRHLGMDDVPLKLRQWH